MGYDDYVTRQPDEDRYAERCDLCGGDVSRCDCQPEDSVCSECGRSDGHDAPDGVCGNGRRIYKGAA